MNKTNRHYFTRYVLLVFLAFAKPAYSINADLSEVRHLYNTGTPALALRMLEIYQPLLSVDARLWEEWEKLRFEIYFEQKYFNALTERYDNLPAEVSSQFRDWAVTFASSVRNKQGAGKVARATLVRQVWSAPPRNDKELIKQWQFQIIASYLNEGNLADAKTAMDLFAKDYGADEREFRILKARYYLMSGSPEKVVEALSKKDSGEAYALYLYARLQSKQEKPVQVMNAAIKSAGKKTEDAENKFRFWLLSARAALAAEYYAQYVKSMEQATRLLSDAPVDELFYHNTDRLWLAYQSYAFFLAGKDGLIGHKDDGWLALASKYAKKRPERARAIYAVLAQGANSEENRMKAHKELVKKLDMVKNGSEIVQQLYMHSAQYENVTVVPVAVRKYLADKAVKEGKIKLASAMINGLEDDDKDKTKEILRRARIHIIAGNTQEGVSILKDVLASEENISEKELDRVMQVVFDLQKANEHFTAFMLFETLYKATTNKKRKREMLYWMADSKRALGEYDEAARLYLLSAWINDNKAADPWADSAKYQAAQTLSEGGYIKDSYILFNKLLRTSSDPRHRQVLKQEMEKLRFRE